MTPVFLGGGDATSRDGLEIPTHDFIVNTYDGSNNMLTSTFKRGGASGRTVAILTMTYDANNNLLTVTKS
jgi:hypothetical protein